MHSTDFSFHIIILLYYKSLLLQNERNVRYGQVNLRYVISTSILMWYSELVHYRAKMSQNVCE